MVQEKTCKECGAYFLGFTPVCKICTIAKREITDRQQHAIGGLEYKPLINSPRATGTTSHKENLRDSVALMDGQEVSSSRAQDVLLAENRRKTKNCKNYPNCRYSDEDCHFLHPSELKTPFSHLKKVCVQFKNEGKCRYGSHCQYAHHFQNRDTSIDTHKTTSTLPSFGIMQQPTAI